MQLKGRVVILGLLGLCVFFFLTLEINPFPHDGWFSSQYRIWERHPGGTNFTPVAAPALLYGGIHWLASGLGLSFESEFLLGSLAHQLLLWGSASFTFLALRRLKMFWSGALAGFALVLFLESTYLPASFWSENVTLFLVSFILWAGVEIAVGAPEGPKLAALTVGASLALGLAVITRATPILLAPGLIAFVWPSLSPQGRMRFTAVVTGVIVTMAIAQMTLNHRRYGRFELSHSVGLRLWDSISFISNRVLAESDLYQSMKQMKPDIQGAWWWELPHPDGVGPDIHDLEDAVRPMVLEGIRRHPLLFLREGVRDFWRTLPHAPNSIGLSRATYYNPLDREDFLPPPGLQIAGLSTWLDRGRIAARLAYPWTLAAGLCGGGVFLLAGATNRRANREGHEVLLLRTWLWAGYCLLGIVYLSNQVEKPDPRFTAPYLAYAALLCVLGIRLGAGALRRPEPTQRSS